MFVITDEKGVIIAISETLSYQDNGNPLVYDGELAISTGIVGGIFENVIVPDDVSEFTHSYIDGIFSKNPDPEPDSEPESSPDSDYVKYDELGTAIREGVNLVD